MFQRMRFACLLWAVIVASTSPGCRTADSAAQVCAAEEADVSMRTMTDAEIAALRAEGPAALERLLKEYDAAAKRYDRSQFETLVDRVAGQRYATVSRLFWYTDIEAARAASRASGKPILSLRMLGRLDEDQSCANSRFFRVVLYGNKELSAWLKDTFVLHWSSERPVPKLTIDYGDGRFVETTVAGNAAHYVLDADGRVIDILPGLVTPKAFRAELEPAIDLAAAVAAAKDEDARDRLIIGHHETRLAAIEREWSAIVPAELRPASTLANAERLTMSKALVELPVVAAAKLGPTDLPTASPMWSQIGASLLAKRGLERTPADVLDSQSTALVDALHPIDWSSSKPLDMDGRTALQAAFATTIVADTGINLTRLRMQIHRELLGRARGKTGRAFDSVNEWLYRDVFLTPADDRWLGLATPNTFTGLPRDGITISG
jgi:hypothetical protein